MVSTDTTLWYQFSLMSRCGITATFFGTEEMNTFPLKGTKSVSAVQNISCKQFPWLHLQAKLTCNCVVMPRATHRGYATLSLLIWPIRSVSMQAQLPRGGDTQLTNCCSSHQALRTLRLSLTPWATSSLFAMSMGTTSTVLHVCSSSWWTCTRIKGSEDKSVPQVSPSALRENVSSLINAHFTSHGCLTLSSTIVKWVPAGTALLYCRVAAPWWPRKRLYNYL